jgi:uncharacterized protein YoxC
MLAFSAGDAADVALAVFLIAVGLGLAWALVRLAATFGRLSSFIRGTEQELLPVISKVGGSVERVNAQLDKLDQVTDSAVEAVDAVDQTVRTISFAVKTPVRKVAGLSSGLSSGFATLRARRDWRSAVESAKAAAARREADLDEELRRAHE